MTTTESLATTPGTARLPWAVYALALGTFCLGTSEFMVAGLLPQISTSLHVSLSQAGMLITTFAVGMLVGAPVMTLATLRLPRRGTMLAAAVAFAAAHALVLVADGYTVAVVARVLAAVACATFWAMAAVIAARLASPDRTARAMAAVVGGLTLANVVGVPAGTWIGDELGWRAAFAAVAIASAAVVLPLWLMVPKDQNDTSGLGMTTLLRRELGAFTDRRLWLALATTATFQAAVFCSFSYLAPLLTDVAGVAPGHVPAVLLVFGVGTLAGVVLGGRYGDRDLLLNVLVSLTSLALALALLAALAGSSVGATVGTFLFGATAFSIAPSLNGRVFQFAGSAPTLAASANVSAFNVGNAVGPWVGGLVIDAGFGLRAPIWAAIALTVAALSIALVSRRVECWRRPAREGVTDCAIACGVPS